MFIGKKPQKKTIESAQTDDNVSAAVPDNNLIFDVTLESFEKDVLAMSNDVPVLADFWAPWCGPCKQLTPVLESEIKAAGGKVRLAKINIDDNPQLAQAMQVQSVPTVLAFYRGQPVHGFAGAKPQSEVKAFIHQLLQIVRENQPDSLDIPEVLKQAASALSTKDFATAQQYYMAVLGEDDQNADAYTGLIRTFTGAGMIEQARKVFDQVPTAVATDPKFKPARTALELAEAGQEQNADIQDLQSRLEKNPEDHEARYGLANALFSRDPEKAIDELLMIIKADPEWQDKKARVKLLEFFDALGPSDPVTIQGRRKLSSLLFS